MYKKSSTNIFATELPFNSTVSEILEYIFVECVKIAKVKLPIEWYNYVDYGGIK